MARYGQRPENALKRANEFIEVGKPARALDTLQEVFRNKKWAYNWSESVLEPIMFKYLDLCVELKKSHIAKEGLFQYRNMFQSVNVGSLENVIRGYLRMAEEKTENAREQSAQAVIDIDDLDNLATPESILLSAVSGEDAQDRSDRTILTPWVKFLWESYCQCLELLRTNAHVENLYHDIARMAFQFCLKYNRKTEFRKLCDKLRKHLEDICKLPAQVTNVSMSKPETQQLNLETRLHQLDFAIQMELWQEAYKAIEDINNLMNLSKKMPVPKTMANYYQKLAMVFWKAGNYLFHAAALFKLLQLSKEMKKNITQEELQKMACRVLVATLAIPLPSAHPEFDRFIETDKSPLEKAQRLAILLGLMQPPTRASLLKDLVRINVVNLATPQLQDLYKWLEVDFDPLSLCPRVHAVIEQIRSDETGVALQQYIPALQDVTLVRLVRQVAQVYQTIEFARLIELAKFATPFHLERLLVDCVRHNDMQIREQCVCGFSIMRVIFCIAAFIGLIHCTLSTSNVICYHGTWSQYRTGNGQFSVTDVPANLCTHYIYAFVGLDSSTSEVITLDSWLDFSIGAISQAISLKETNPNLKVLLAVGGWNEGSAKFSTMAADATKRATFIASSLSWVETYGFDGFDLDWEYPARRDSTNTATDKANFALLVKEMAEEYHSRDLLLTAAVSATPDSVDTSYDVPTLSEYLDFINVMLYDFHGTWDGAAYHNAPLYSTTKLAGTEYADYSVNASITGWIERGASPSKLALGVPFYGRTAILASASSNTPGSTLSSVAPSAGPYTATSGFLGYNEIIEEFNAGGWTTAWDDEQQVPYAYSGTDWLSYENEESIALKVAYANSLGLGAIMLWSIETEDFLGLSGTKYPLLNAIQNALSSSSSSNETTSSTTTTTTTTTTSSASVGATASTTASSTSSASSTTSTTTTTAASSTNSARIADKNSCQSTGYFGSSADCSIYFYCVEVNGVFVGYQFSCYTGLVYDTDYGVCNYESLVNNC